MNTKNNIVLIGMPASGKSTIGVLLAKALGKNFIDTDLIIQRNHNCQLQSLLDNVGLENFRIIEAQAIKSLDCSDCVIATGGSAIYDDQAMNKLKQGGVIVYLCIGLGEIQKRLTDIQTRGLVISKGQTLQQLYDIRKLLYEKHADITIDTNHLSHEQTVAEIINSRP
jgi:shikimate kinase